MNTESVVCDFKKCVDKLFIEAYVESVYDGDSIKLIFPFHGKDYKWTCRLNGIDTPEIRTSDLKEKGFGLKIRDIVREKILNKKFNILCHSFDKYGRLLVDLYLHEEDTLNDWLINQKYAIAYDGGKKQSWSDMLTIIGN
jgi:endonuclease YncB( thermonuclease family)